MSDVEFIRFFQHKNKAHCGRFTQRQLSLNIPPKPVSVLPLLKMRRYAAAGLLALLGYSYKASAQVKIAAPTYQNQSEQHQQQNASVKSNSEDTVILKGFVKDEKGAPISTAVINLEKEEDVATMPDDDGSFVLQINVHDLNDILVVEGIGYKTIKVSISNIENKEAINLTLEDDPNSISLGVVVYGRKVTFWRRVTKPIRRLFRKT